MTTSWLNKGQTATLGGVVTEAFQMVLGCSAGGGKWDWQLPRPEQTKTGFLRELKVAWHGEAEDRGSTASKPRHSGHEMTGPGPRTLGRGVR